MAFHTSSTRHDADGRLIQVEQGWLPAWQPESVAPTSWPGFHQERRIDTEYDALDRKTREWTSSGAAALNVTEYSYDLAGRLKCTAVRMNPDFWSTPLADKCAPGPAHATHGRDRIARNVYDTAGRLIESWDGVGTPLERREAAYTYNANDQKLSLVDARGYRAEMRYDGFGRQQRWIFPSKTTPGLADESDYEQYLYDPAGNRTRLRKRDGSELTFQYDALNRMTAKIVPERLGLDPVHTRDVHYDYDLRGLQTRARFGSLSGEGITNIYDGFGRASSSTLAMAGTSRTIGHLYDAEGRESELAFPDGQRFWTKRDGLGRATDDYQGPLGSTSTIMTAFAYNPAGQRSYFARRFGDMTGYLYDGAGRLSLHRDQFGAGVGNTESNFLYNPAGQLAGETRNNDDYAWRGAVAVSRDYARNGQNQYTGTVSDGATSATFTHDANGNLISDGTTSFLYDVENRLVSASGAKNASLVYDPLGRLFQISSAAGVTQFLYDGDELVAEYNGSGTMLRRYIHGDSDDDPLFWYEGAGFDQPRFPHTDRQGSITGIAGPGSWLLSINTYDEYGIPGANNVGRFQYTGQAWLQELGLYYYKARIYSPTLGRFLQVDPIGYDDQINLYAYVGNDPRNRVDPNGESWRGVVDTLADSWESLKETPGVVAHDLNELRKDLAKDFFGTAGQVLDSVPPNPGTAAVGMVRAGGRMFVSLGKMAKAEYANLSRLWSKGTFDRIQDSLRYHFREHGRGLAFSTYLRRASQFNYKGAQRINRANDTIFRRKNGEYIIVDKAGRILSYDPGRSFVTGSRIRR